jgi:D-galactarolactone cycloisomerase
VKIVDVVPHVLSAPLEEPFFFSQGWVERRSTMIVEVSTDEGITGWGESLCHGLQPPEVASSFVEYCCLCSSTTGRRIPSGRISSVE